MDIIKTDPAVQNVVAFTGGGGAVNTGFIYLALKPLEERKISASQVIDRLRPKLISIPGATVFLQAGQDLRIGGRQSNAQYQYTIQSDNIDDLVNWGPLLLHRNEETARSSPTLIPISKTAACRPRWSTTATPRRAWESRRN